MNRSGGFSLLEVLVALVVVAVLLFALVRNAGQEVRAHEHVRDRTYGTWIAANVLAETRLATPWPAPGRSQGRERFAQREWEWEMLVQTTDEPQVRRMDVRVYPAGERENAVAELTGFAGQR